MGYKSIPDELGRKKQISGYLKTVRKMSEVWYFC